MAKFTFSEGAFTAGDELDQLLYHANTKTIGKGQEFETLGEAIDWLNTQATFDLVSGVTGTVTASQYDYALVGTNTNWLDKLRVGDLLDITDINTGANVFDSGTIYIPVRFPIKTEGEATLSMAIPGTAITAKSHNIIRPKRYVFELLEEQELTSVRDLPETVNLLIKGRGSSARIYSNVTSSNGAIGLPLNGYLAFSHVDIVQLDTAPVVYTGGNFGTLMPGNAIITMQNCTSYSQFGSILLNGSEVRINNCEFDSSGGGALNVQSDFFFANGITSVADGTGDNLVLTGQAGIRPGNVREYAIHNLFVTRDNSVAAGAGAAIEFGESNAANSIKRYFLNSAEIKDTNQGNAGDNGLKLFGSTGKTKHFTQNVVIEQSGSGATHSSDVPTDVIFKNVFDITGAALTP